MTPFSKHTGQKNAEQVQFEPRTADDSLSAGMIVSCGAHALLIMAIVFGLPIFWDPDPLPAVIGIEMAQPSDITASNAKIPGPVKPETPKLAAVKPQEAPKKEAPPPPPAPQASAPPPPPEEEEEIAEPIPDPTAEMKLAEEKKAEEDKKKQEEEKKKKKEEDKKKKEEEKKKKEKQKKEEAQFDDFMRTLTSEQPAPEPEEKPAKKQKPVEQQAATGEVTPEYSPIPLNAGEENGIRSAIENNWIVPLGLPNIDTYKIELRLHMNRNGSVAKIDVLSPMNDNAARAITASAIRAVNKTVQQEGRLPVPADKYNSTILLRWDMALVCSQMGC